MDAYYKMLEANRNLIKKKFDFTPEIALTLGSGLQDLAKEVKEIGRISYKELKNFPINTNKAHAGELIFGTLAGKNVICLNGRLHYYEGHSAHDCVAPIRLAHMLGATKFINTHSVGAINEKYKEGEFMVCTSTISHFVPSPLRGPNLAKLGDRFIDTTLMFDDDFNKLMLKIGQESGITVHEGWAVQSIGPHFETVADIEMFRRAGADVVGMSGSQESVAARHMGMRVVELTFVSNMAAGVTGQPLTDEEVQECAGKAAINFKKLIFKFLEEC